MLEQAAAAFHFLRPWWLVALIPTALILSLIARRDRVDVQWSGVIAPNLLKHMIVTPPRRWHIRPPYLVGLALVLMATAIPYTKLGSEFMPPLDEGTLL